MSSKFENHRKQARHYSKKERNFALIEKKQHKIQNNNFMSTNSKIEKLKNTLGDAENFRKLVWLLA
jgi:hypothetical protein